MKFRLAALILAAVSVHIVYSPLQAQPAPAIPFADGISIEAAVGSNVTLYARQTGGTYVPIQFKVTPPYSLGPPATLLQLLADGPKTLLDAPGAPAGIGLQSEGFAFTDLDNKGSLGVAYVYTGGPDNSVVVFKATLGITGPTITTQTYMVGTNANSTFFADFNHDGYPDLAVAYSGDVNTPGGIAILLNKGDGTFGNPITYANGTQATHFAVLDLNADGALDIATAALGQTVTVVLGKGDGTFGSPTSYPVGGSGEAIAIADFNGDTIPDIVAGSGILLGNGNGTFRAGPSLPTSSTLLNNFVWAYAAGDLDGDGKMDLAYADIQNQFVVPLFGNGDGTFQMGPVAYAVSQFPDSLVLADYNNDGHLDIINGNGDQRGFGPSDQSGNIDIILNNGNRTFQGVSTYLGPQYGFEQANGVGAAVANFGGGSPGVLASSYNGTLTLFRGDGKGGFQTPQNFSIPAPMQGSTASAGAIAAADFNGDKNPDAAVLTSNGVAILLANSNGFGTPTIISAGAARPTSLAAADFDGDGKADLVIVGTDSQGAGTLAFLKGNGDGSFQMPVTIPAGINPLHMSAVDINGDKKLDVVFSDGGATGPDGGIYVALNMGGGVFQAPAKVVPALLPSFAVADVNGDGKLDLVLASETGEGESAISVVDGNGNGTFQSPVSIATSDSPYSFVVAQDFNGDGHADIVVAHQSSGTGFLAGNDDGTFSAEVPFNSAYEPIALLVTDLNSDGNPDLIVVGFTLTVLLNDSAPPTTIQTNPAGLQFSVDQGPAQTAPQTLSLSQGSHSIAVTSPQAGATGVQYVFSGWSDQGAASHSIKIGSTATTYTATFTTQYQLTISAAPSGTGTVMPASGTFYDSGSIVPVAATANSGSTFSNWTGSVANSTSSSTTVTMTGPETLTANFSGGGGHPAFFSGEVSLGSGVYYLQFPNSNLFGYYNYVASSIFYHYDMGYEAFVPSTNGQIYLFDFTTGHWWYTSSSLFPYLYDFTLNTFVYYFPNTKNSGHYTSNPRYFVNLNTGLIFTM